MNRAFIALLSGNFTAQRDALAEALSIAEEAVELDPSSSSAYETRGRAHLNRWLLLPKLDDSSADALRHAEADLVQAITLDPDNARAASALSTLYETQGRFEDARRAALRALDADAYLEDVEQIVVRLFHTSFEVGDDVQAGHWCDETRRRFPGGWPAAYCDLVLIGWRDNAVPDARKALYVLETFGGAEHPEMRKHIWPRLAMLAAVAVARSGDTARADALVKEARAAGMGDPELKHFEAAYWFRIGENGPGASLLSEYLKGNPKARARLANGRMYRPLQAQIAQTAADR